VPLSCLKLYINCAAIGEEIIIFFEPTAVKSASADESMPVAVGCDEGDKMG
jgi:hypothetical protein